MPTFIKTGFWEKKQKGFRDWLNLDNLIEQYIQPQTASVPPFLNPPTLVINGKETNVINLNALNTYTPAIYSDSLVFIELETITGNYGGNNNFQNIISSHNVTNKFYFQNLSFPQLKYLYYFDLGNNYYNSLEFNINYLLTLKTISIPNALSGGFNISNNSALEDVELGLGGYVIDENNQIGSYYAISNNNALKNVIIHNSNQGINLNGDYGYTYIDVNNCVNIVNIDARKLVNGYVNINGTNYNLQNFEELIEGGVGMYGSTQTSLSFPKGKNLEIFLDGSTHTTPINTLDFPIAEVLYIAFNNISFPALNIPNSCTNLDIYFTNTELGAFNIANSVTQLYLFIDNSNLTTINIPNSCTYLYIDFIYNNASLTDVIGLSNVQYLDGQVINLTNNALTQSSVDAVLAKVVDMLNLVDPNYNFQIISVDLSGGTNSTPSAAGIANANILIAAGLTIAYN